MLTVNHRSSAIDNLREARRYVGSCPEITRGIVASALSNIHELPNPKCDRLVENLKIATKYIQVSPDVCRGYIDGCIFELQCIKEDE